ncbi:MULTISPECIES: hypothetical protein [Dehalobacter]|uniref:Lipoprotein n=2 Tax=Dehalobacter restrictus TaxID=55583 RepID=A0A857DNI4_9FIRM|nr:MULTISPECIES: hypothetical protein [Dehalobacter]AHF10951.1 hypothetical protein DEHRE_13485 [Dehalobacter restrictus DSM 9455]MDJ0307102.1 hypothetical protein [Dehalobacter sp.]OCZ49639.1 hypothetical protein A7D23_02060 [Dehalobacter sp. TeCB1]QHA01596.1 hypothetical protein GQ588_13580 [Dehalobacter restrictus]
MKGRVFLTAFLILSFFVTLSGCSGQTDQSKNSEVPRNGVQTEDQQSANKGDQVQSDGVEIDGAETGGAGIDGAGTDGTETDKKENKESDNQEISVVAKSGTRSADEEKEAVLDEISRELDEIINTVNAMDDIEENDLK